MSYLEARKSLGLSRERLSSLAKLAGIRVSPASIKKLEDQGEEAVGGRGLSDSVVGYINYVLGLGEFDTANWASVEKGAPVVVTGEKGVYSFISADDVNVTVFGSSLKTVSSKDARPAAPSATPSEANAHLFEKRTRGDGGVYAKQVMNYISQHADQPHSVGALAYALSLDNSIISRTITSLIKSGKLSKVSRGVVTLAGEAVMSDAEWEASVNAPTEDIPQF
jgi:hypothetical protein